MWRHDGKEIYFFRGAERMAVSLDSSDRSLRIGPPRSLFRVAMPPRMIPSHRFDVTADGKSSWEWNGCRTRPVFPLPCRELEESAREPVTGNRVMPSGARRLAARA